ncbi:MAG: hypothetical protein LIR46_10155 [Bacteroidota bacterium]|nr:hypothetical protein [Bacteroidota bacterium]
MENCHGNKTINSPGIVAWLRHAEPFHGQRIECTYMVVPTLCGELRRISTGGKESIRWV